MGAGVGGGVGRALGGRWEGVGTWEGVGRALVGRWRVVRVGPGSLIYRQIMKLRRRGEEKVRCGSQPCCTT